MVLFSPCQSTGVTGGWEGDDDGNITVPRATLARRRSAGNGLAVTTATTAALRSCRQHYSSWSPNAIRARRQKRAHIFSIVYGYFFTHSTFRRTVKILSYIDFDRCLDFQVRVWRPEVCCFGFALEYLVFIRVTRISVIIIYIQVGY